MCDCRFWCEDENFAYFVVDDNGKGSRILVRSGGGMPLIISSETFSKIVGMCKVFTQILPRMWKKVGG